MRVCNHSCVPNAQANFSTFAHNSKMMSQDDTYTVLYQTLPVFPTLLACFLGPYCWTVKWRSTIEHTENETQASLSLCKHTTQTDGGWRHHFV